MRFSLRTLLILMLLAGPLGALGWKEWLAYRERVAIAEARAKELERQVAILLQVNRVQLMWISSSTNSPPLESPTAREIWAKPCCSGRVFRRVNRTRGNNRHNFHYEHGCDAPKRPFLGSIVGHHRSKLPGTALVVVQQ